MKIIDLLNKIANGEEVPKKIRFNNIEWNKVYGEKNVCYINEYDSDFFLYFFRKNLDFTLNDEVEIIEEEKEIKHINIQYWRDDEYTPEERINVCMTTINQLIDVINDMRDKEC